MPNSTRTRGRQRSEAVRQAILKAAYEMLQESDFASVTIEGIAARAGTAKTTIYRWWSSKSAVLIDAFLEVTRSKTEFPDTDSVVEVFKRQIPLLVQAYAGETGHSVASIIAAGQMDKEAIEAFRIRYLAIRRSVAKMLIERGIEQGIFASDLDPEVAIDLLYGPIYFRLLVGHGSLDLAFAEKLVEHGMRGLLSRSHCNDDTMIAIEQSAG
ncbi:MAG: TetR/AcrR family transcriptional regulator [Cyanobacteria bacterium CRU_2_1]|nr:TetR/AcrR family transcriptional regulator [Cyanobacteria bacterium RU_5_0]NJR57991.1 TetR/AcrR family transcriptional regulator [Cyanobacteria bacterium CRU_2_1]